MTEPKNRIWELDALRGLCILGMIAVHFVFDLIYITNRMISLPAWFFFVQSNGHVLFILISGICATLASRSFRRGVVVFAAGLLVSYATLFLDAVLQANGLRIWFGILHLLGVCMMLYPICKRFPAWLLFVLGAAFVALGIWMRTVTVSVDFLFPIGLCSESFYTGSDFFPIFPGFGWFLLGAALGKSVYRKKSTLLPKVNSNLFVFKALRFIGKNSLPIYLLHQPILFALTFLISRLL